MKRILITGGAGFIGHHFVEHLLKTTEWEIVLLDRLNYSGTFDRLRDIKAFDDKRVSIFTSDFTQPITENLEKEIGELNYIVHMGAETHVDNSIESARPFVLSNVLGTMEVLEFARRQKDLELFLYFSTDEVFGPAPVGTEYKEWDRYDSGNPYAAAKAGGEELCLAYGNSYGIPIIITHTMNAFGERQHPEKFIPMCINTIQNGETVTIHSSADKKTSGSRFYIHCRNISSAITFLIEKGITQDKYNIVGEMEVSNLKLAQTIADIMGEELKYEMVDFHSQRPGHDLRYALDGGKMRDMGWQPDINFVKSLERTVQWSLENDRWLKWN